ncbi:AGE family epimerase/isomerase [Chitinimonas sp.]|uniref:AGE family epimerase/isomerase n=1 Tax=Chitinimonas sp. TaxID=1934313 RepID=UPI002F920854
MRRLLPLLRWLGPLCALFLWACGQAWNTRHRVDADWHRNSLGQGHLVHWLAAAQTDNGFFQAARDRRWQALAGQPGDLVSQARLIYVLAAGYDQTHEPSYLARMRQGADFLLSAYRDPDYGGYYEAVSPRGTPTNDGKRLYSQAFAILALARSYQLTHDPRYAEAGLAAWRTVAEHMRDPAGGYRTASDRAFTGGSGNAQNGIMHLFEAMLALHAATGSKEAREGAAEVGNFVAYRLLVGLPDGSACIPEYFHTDWQVLTAEQGGYIDVGHQFEWSWLLSRGAEQGINPIYAGVADRVLDFALKRGLDPANGGIYTTVDYRGLKDGSKGYWQQAEALRAMLYFAVNGRRNDLWGRITQLTEYIQSEFVDAEQGGWYAHPATECKKTPACMEMQPDGYHMTALHMEALRLVGDER